MMLPSVLRDTEQVVCTITWLSSIRPSSEHSGRKMLLRPMPTYIGKSLSIGFKFANQLSLLFSDETGLVRRERNRCEAEKLSGSHIQTPDSNTSRCNQQCSDWWPPTDLVANLSLKIRAQVKTTARSVYIEENQW